MPNIPSRCIDILTIGGGDHFSRGILTIDILTIATQRIAPYETILGAFNIKYTSRAYVKGQFLIDLATKTVEPLPNEMTEA